MLASVIPAAYDLMILPAASRLRMFWRIVVYVGDGNLKEALGAEEGKICRVALQRLPVWSHREALLTHLQAL